MTKLITSLKQQNGAFVLQRNLQFLLTGLDIIARH